jgi:hypothetical protein
VNAGHYSFRPIRLVRNMDIMARGTKAIMLMAQASPMSHAIGLSPLSSQTLVPCPVKTSDQAHMSHRKY